MSSENERLNRAIERIKSRKDVEAAIRLRAERRTNLGGVMRSSAESCIQDAESQLAKGNDVSARMWAVKSLKYSVGVFSPIYDACK